MPSRINSSACSARSRRSSLAVPPPAVPSLPLGVGFGLWGCLPEHLHRIARDCIGSCVKISRDMFHRENYVPLGQQKRYITNGCLLVRDCSTCTTAMLSHLVSTRWPAHNLPHTAVANTMGRSSFTVMDCSGQSATQANCSHLLWHKASQPQEPEASETITTSGGARRCVLRQDRPFHFSRKRLHHCKSDLNSGVSVTQWCSLSYEWARSSIRRMNVRHLSCMTQVANE